MGIAAQRSTKIILAVLEEGWSRAAVRGLLAGRGYRVLLAATGVEALALGLEYPAPIDLLITDMRPRRWCNTPELAECLLVLCPGMSVLFLGEDGPTLPGPEAGAQARTEALARLESAVDRALFGLGRDIPSPRTPSAKSGADRVAAPARDDSTVSFLPAAVQLRGFTA